ncbi:MAG: diguanylate cyclase [Ruminococcaceae bacterium]|nr:diguanylate cyclase [Oscillospiraceae bacterium]
MQRRSVDISQLYDLFSERRECWFVLTDMVNLIAINEISRKAGDLCLIEQMNRMVAATGDDDVIFRIGGDEFCILTASSDEAYANSVIEKIRAFNGQAVNFEGRDIPLSLYTVATRFSSGSLRYNDLFSHLHLALRDSKQ